MGEIQVSQKTESTIRIIGIVAGAVVLSMALGGGAVWWWMRNHAEADRQAEIIREIVRTNTVIVDRIRYIERSNTVIEKQYVTLTNQVGNADEIKMSDLDTAIRLFMGR
jgi:hypothetical protein